MAKAKRVLNKGEVNFSIVRIIGGELVTAVRNKWVVHDGYLRRLITEFLEVGLKNVRSSLGKFMASLS